VSGIDRKSLKRRGSRDVGVKRGMMMIQRLRLLPVILFALYCGSAFALGLGELDLKSALNQRFDAEIVLLNTGDLEQVEIIPSLAAEEDFERVGVNRDYHLTDLRFNAQLREDGTHIVHITSRKPIIEPFLNFIVEVLWPNGRILREYIVLLDPPVFSSEGIEKIEPSWSIGSASVGSTSGGNASSGRIAPTQSGSRSGSGLEIPPVRSAGNRRTQGIVTGDEEYGVTGRGDTLWTIASKVRPNERTSVQQTMLALQRANPEAFISNNINLLKAGYVLRIPDESEIRAETLEEADVEVLVQNQEFEDYIASDVTQIDARRAASGGAAGSDDRDNGELKLLAADQSGARSGRDDTRADKLENSLAVAREDLDRSQRANSELNARLSYIDGQVETLSELVKLKDDQLAALRAELERQAAETIAPPVEPVVVQQQASVSLLSSPVVLGAIGVLLIGLVAGALMMLRKRRQEFQLDDNEFSETIIEEDHPQSSSNDLGDESTDGVTEDSTEEESEEFDEDFTQQTNDVIGEAEIYIDYGRFPQAISFLQKAIENEPQRTDIQLRLLEVYVQTEDAAAFNLQYEQLKLLADDDATSEGAELQAEILAGADTSDLDLDLDLDAAAVSSEPIVAMEDSGIEDDDLSFDLDLDLEDLDDIDDLEAETDDTDLGLTTDIGEVLNLEEALEPGDSDFDLDLDASLEEEPVLSKEAEEDLDLALGLDNEIDLDFGDDVIDGEDDVLDLDLDLDLDDDDILELDDDILEFDDDILELDADDTLELGDDDILEPDDDDVLEPDDDDALELDDDDVLELDDDDTLELGDDDALEHDDDDVLELSADDTLELGDDDVLEHDDDDTLELGDDDILEHDDDDTLELGDDDALELDDDDILEFGDDDILELVDDDAVELDLDDDGEFDLGFADDDDELNLEEDAGSKLDLARAYIEMGDNGGAKPLLEAVLGEGDEAQIGEANELLGNIR
jgi:pilus assembly protein FimV